MKPAQRVRVRFAPSPTGPLHMGGVRTALYNYLFARKHGGDFLLRIEDTDQTRYVAGAEEYILEALEWCGIPPQEGPVQGGPHAPYRQSERKHLYRDYADQLLQSGHAYYAFDSPEALDEMREKMRKAKVASPQYNAITRSSMQNALTLSGDEVQRRIAAGEPYVIRFKMPRNEEVKIHDAIRGWVSVNTAQLDDKVLFKSDAMPTYHLANIVDDHLMQISHVIRGEEWLPSAPLHALLYRAFGWQEPIFAHLPLLLKPDGNGKLSKRDGDRLGFPVFPLQWEDPQSGEVSSGYRERGYYPQAFINMLALLGWNPGDNRELFTLEELVEAFSLERVNKSGARFDPDKALWFNQQYLRSSPDADLAAQVKPLCAEAGYQVSDAYLIRVCQLMKERATFPAQIITEGKYFFEAPAEYDREVLSKKWKATSAGHLRQLRLAFAALPSFEAAALEQSFKHYLEQQNLSMGALLPLLRIAITGRAQGPSLFELLELLGPEESLQRLDTALRSLP